MIYKKIIFVISALLLTVNVALANHYSSIVFFASNNNKQIDLKTAYQRLAGKEQRDLENKMIIVLQKNHLEQGNFADILGKYSLSNHMTTADNTKQFTTSPNQSISVKQAFAIATQLARSLNQEAVAILFPDQHIVTGIEVRFTSHQPTIDQVVSFINRNLSASAKQNYSLFLTNVCGKFGAAKVNKLEWLSSKIKIEDIKKVFPHEDIRYHSGKAFLVYQNGKKKEL